jgi:hypothetical protein
MDQAFYLIRRLRLLPPYHLHSPPLPSNPHKPPTLEPCCRFRQAWKDPAFQAAVSARWGALRGGQLSDAAIAAKLRDTVALIEPAALRNYK